MSKKRRSNTSPGAITILPIEWRDAERRLELMEEGARLAIAAGHASIRVVAPEQPIPAPPILVPGKIAGLLLGPDGKPMKEV